MKKLLSVIFAILMIALVPFSLFGCDKAATQYNVKVNMWYAGYGTVYGGDSYDVGSTVKITAIPKQSYTFMAWLKDNVVVSYDAEYSFEMSMETSGTYTAIFSLRDPKQIVTLKQIEFIDEYQEGVEYKNLEATFMVGSSYKLLHQVLQTQIDAEKTFDIETIKLVLNAKEKIMAQVNLVYTIKTTIDGEEVETNQSAQTLIEIDLNAIGSNVAEYQINLPTGIKGTVIAKFTFDTFTIGNQESSEA